MLIQSLFSCKTTLQAMFLVLQQQFLQREAYAPYISHPTLLISIPLSRIRIPWRNTFQNFTVYNRPLQINEPRCSLECSFAGLSELLQMLAHLLRSWSMQPFKFGNQPPVSWSQWFGHRQWCQKCVLERGLFTLAESWYKTVWTRSLCI